MKKLFLLLISIVWIVFAGNAQVGINTDGSAPEPSAGLDVKFNNKGLLPPRMTHAQLNAIPSPADGLIVYCTDCGANGVGSLSLFMAGAWYTLSANCLNPLSPLSGTHTASPTQIVWNWSTVLNATGYKWNTTNNYATATDMSAATTKTETGLSCLTPYTRYIWAYSACGVSAATILSQTTSGAVINSPAAGTHVPSLNQIVWKWTSVAGATGYRWSATNDFASATDMGSGLMIVETGMTCNTTYTRFVWAYSECGNSLPTPLIQATLSTPVNAPAAGTHVPAPTQIVWNWNTVSGATGYKWNTTNNYATATDMGTATAKTETGLTCNTQYLRFVWAYNACGISTATSLSQSTTGSAVTAPVSGTHVPSPTQIVWNWNAVSGATGYKWNTTNDYASATDMVAATTKTETGLICLTSYTRYVWAYNACGYSSATPLNQSTTGSTVTAPTAGTHVPSPTQIVWNWNTVAGATGYKWNTTNNYSSATDMVAATTKTETGLTCNTAYTRYVWAYNLCGYSTATTLTQSTSLNPPAAPTAGTHIPTPTQIVWNWNTVAGATGYKWNTTNDYASATDMVAATTKTETGLTCNTPYTRFVWAYNACGNSSATTLSQSTTITPTTPTTGTHVPSATQIVWNWNPVTGATGYKWNITTDYVTATDMGTATTKTETGLVCITTYTRYIWAYSSCGYSAMGTMSQTTTTNPPAAPTPGTHVPSPTQIVWNWNTVSGAIGYKWNTTNIYATATDMGTGTTKTETGLDCATSYTRYIWAYGVCGNSIASTLTQMTIGTPITAPLSGTHVPYQTQIVWNWNSVAGASGYKWNTTNNYATATEMGTSLTKTETGLACGILYTRYIWAYGICGISTSTTITQTTLSTLPSPPASGTHVANPIQIIWNWNAVSGATGYKWNTTNNYATATEMGTALTKTETGLTCGTEYTRYVWAYGPCGNSTATPLSQSTFSTVSTPTEGTHVANSTQIVWNWNTVTGATGYKWNNINDYATATDMGTATSKTETGLTPGTSYTRYVWAYNTCGISISLTITSQTLLCGGSFTINHTAGSVAPVTKTVTYGTVTNIPGATSKCWITSNLGASQQATAVSDATETSSGWYWQFNRKQGYKHDGTTRTPNSAWNSNINENSDWTVANDPCTIELGSGWRIPTSTEWTNVDASGNWTNWNGPWNSLLKMHAAGRLNVSDGSLVERGSSGYYWSSTQGEATSGWGLYFGSGYCYMSNYVSKADGCTARCIRDN